MSRAQRRRRTNNRKFGSELTSLAKGSGIEVLRTPYRVPRPNAICERFLSSVRRECLDHLPILSECQLNRVIQEYVTFFDAARLHQGIAQQVPGQLGSSGEERRMGKIIAFPVLNGLHHAYRRVA
jgi:putative transposase